MERGRADRSIAPIAMAMGRDFPVRFVILKHAQVEGTHWDVLFESPEGSLLGWAFSHPLDRAGWRRARILPPHRTVYLVFQGSLVGGRGRVERVDSGFCQVCEESDQLVRLLLRGEHLAGILECRHDSAEGDWSARFERRPVDGSP